MYHLLIIGCGSIGERHLRCFQSTGRCTVAGCDPAEALRATLAERYGVTMHASLDKALAAERFDAAVICTPAPLHLPMAAKLLRAGLHVFIEKPLALEPSLVPEVREAARAAARQVAVAYVYHAMPWLRAAREFLLSGELGKPLHAVITGGQHFPTYRPAYRDIYYARHEAGGGAIQDALTHLVNATEWCLGPCTRLFCDASHQALEGVSVEDTVNIIARHGEVLVSYAMNQFQAPNEISLQFHCERGSVKVEVHKQSWSSYRHGDSAWTDHPTPALERDGLFTLQANAFLDQLDGQPSPLCTLDEAEQSLRFNVAALLSARERREVALV